MSTDTFRETLSEELPGAATLWVTLLVVHATDVLNQTGDRVTALGRSACQLSDYPVGDLACFNVDFSWECRDRSRMSERGD